MVRSQSGVEPSHVLVFGTLGAPERRRLAGRRARHVEPEPPPAAVSTTRVTVIGADPLADEAAAAEWLTRRGRGKQADVEVDAALVTVNEALWAHRVAAVDPLCPDVGREHALVARIGWGSGEAVAEGRFADAVEVPAPARRRARAESLRPQERLAALLGGRDRRLAAETLALRARHDLDAGHAREAALGLRVALESGLAELERGTEADRLEDRLDELRDDRGPVGEAANAALAGDLDEAARATVGEALRHLEGALRARGLVALDEPAAAHEVAPNE